MRFSIQHKDTGSNARAGLLQTHHGLIPTPVFMPVGTTGSVKGVFQQDLTGDTRTPIILGNTYHLFLRPGVEVIRNAGGLHNFINWDGALLTDSGGYQVFSLSDQRRISEEGAMFRSHIDGTKHHFTPENVVDIQRVIGADIMMAFDECTPWPCEYQYARDSMYLTHRWLDRGIKQYRETDPLYGYHQCWFPIVQGSTYADLRKQSAETVASAGLEGNAIGGLSVGEPEELMYEMVEVVTGILPWDRPRYLMGVGTPVNLLEAVSRGVDMFDCVMPTRNGRNGQLFTAEGMINIKNKKWKDDHSPIDPEGDSFVDQQYSRAYLRHLINSGEMLGAQIASLHNLRFYARLMEEARVHIEQDDFSKWKSSLIPRLSSRI